MKRNVGVKQILVAMCLLAAFGAASQADTWNLTNEWSTANTAASPWKFYQADRGFTVSQFIPMSALASPLWGIPGYNGWEGQAHGTIALVVMNEGSPYYVNPTWTIPVGVVSSMTGVDGLNAVAAWVSPINGTVDLSGLLSDQYNDGNTDDGIDWILGTSTSGTLSSGTILPGGSSILSVEALSVSVGDMIYVMMDPRGNPVADITDIALEITEVPEPASMSLLALGGLAGLIRKRKQLQ